MGRKLKNTVDYFPHQCNHNKTMFILEARFGNNGYACWFKILEELGNHEGHYIDLREDSEQEFLVAKTRLLLPEIKKVLDLLAKLGTIDEKLWISGVVWCGKFVENISDVYKKRGISAPEKPTILPDPPITDISGTRNPT